MKLNNDELAYLRDFKKMLLNHEIETQMEIIDELREGLISDLNIKIELNEKTLAELKKSSMKIVKKFKEIDKPIK